MKLLALSMLLASFAKSLNYNQYQFHGIVSESTNVQTLSHNADAYPSVVGYTNVELSKANQDIDNYIHYRMPELKDAQLVKAQILNNNGINYAYVYRLNNDQLYTVYVWDNPTQRLRQIRGFDKILTNGTQRTTRQVRVSNGNLVQVANNLYA